MPRHRPHTSFLARLSTVGVPALLTLAAVLGACQAQSGSGGSANAAPVPVRSLGEDVYVTSCARCHGVALEGNSSSPALTRARIASLGDQRLEMTIVYGKGQMPGFRGLSAAQIAAVIAYVQGL